MWKLVCSYLPSWYARVLSMKRNLIFILQVSFCVALLLLCLIATYFIQIAR